MGIHLDPGQLSAESDVMARFGLMLFSCEGGKGGLIAQLVGFGLPTQKSRV